MLAMLGTWLTDKSSTVRFACLEQLETAERPVSLGPPVKSQRKATKPTMRAKTLMTRVKTSMTAP